MRPVRVTRHAVDRYVERVRPTLTYDEGFEELRRLVQWKVPQRLPVWAAESLGDDRDDVLAVEISEGIVMVVERATSLKGVDCWLGTTIIVPGGLTEARRERRKQKKAARRERARARQASYGPRRRFNRED